jgi:uncharacterized protein
MSGTPTVIDTHASRLIFFDDQVYKVKKAVNFPFLDLRTAAARRRILLLEAQLNRRLSPDVYLGVGEFVDPEGRREPVLCMRRLPDARRLSTLIREDACTEGDVIDIARKLATFHQMCDIVPAKSTIGSTGQLASLWQDALDVLEGGAGFVPSDQLARLRELANEYLDGRSSLFAHRRSAGRVRDGHGDLLADDIFLLPDGVRILDCLEFDPALRCGDTLLDAAFLAMDIERCGSPSLARSYLDAYRDASADDAPTSLGHYYIAYRAIVRAKVAALRAQQGARTALADARALAALALAHLEEARVRLIVVSGLPASGKSTLASLLQRKWGSRRAGVLLSSDVLRDEVVPRASRHPDEVATGRYSPDQRAEVYRTMFQRAESALTSGVDVILDATFADAWTHTAVADLAKTCHAQLIALRCEVPIAMARQRLARRTRGADTRSEADIDVYRYLAENVDAWPAAHAVDTSVDVAQAFKQVSQLIK